MPFCADNAADFADGSVAKTSATTLTQIIRDLDAAKAAQASLTPTVKEVLLDALRLDHQNITRTARALDLKEPGLADQFRPPATPSQAALLTAVDATLLRFQPQPADDDAATSAKAALVAKFVAHELPEDFVANLADDRAAINTSQDAEASSNNDGVESTATIGRLIRDGMKEMITLDAIMHNKYARQPEKLRAWQSASHIERAPQREKKAPVTTSASFTATPQNQAA